MILPVYEQGRLFLATIIAGFGLAFFYDIFRVTRRIIPHKAVFIHAEDIIYWIIVVSLVFHFLLNSNSGEIRFFIVGGTFIGMLIYTFTLSSIFMKFSMRIYEFLKKIVLLLISIMMAPVRVLICLLSFPVGFLVKRSRIVYKYQKKVYNGVKLRSRNKARKFKNNLKIITKKI